MTKFQPNFKKSIDRSNPTEIKLQHAMKAMCLANATGEYAEAEKCRAEVRKLLNELGVPTA